MSQRLTLFINNEWCRGYGPSFISRNPATEDILWEGESASQEEINAAMIAARNAFEKWSRLTLVQRISYLERFAKILTDEIPALSEWISLEIGKPLWESKAEIQAMIAKVPISIEAYHKRCPEILKDSPNGTSMTRHKPHGVIVVFGPFNFPGHLPNGHIIPALLAGNTVVFKPSEMAPLVAEAIMHCWIKCELPPGVLNMVQGGRETGALLAGHLDIDGLCFTGSCETGRILSERFAKTPDKILALEMGGNNPLVVTKVSDVKAAAYTIIQSAYLTAGQRCSCARRLILLESPQGDEIIQELIRMIKTIKVGPFTERPEPFMGPVISEASARHLLAAQDILKAKGGRPLCEMHLMKVDTALITPGLMDVTRIDKRPDEEFFGPFLQVIRVPDFDAAIEEANRTKYGLTAGLLSTSREEYDEFYQRIKAGVINWNAPLTGARSAAPFGGVKHSGNYRPSAFYSADYCAYPVASLEDAELKLPKTLLPGLII